MIITILGRQPEIGIAELERIYGSRDTRWFSDISAVIDTDNFDFNRLGGSQKAGRVTMEVAGNWQQVSRKIISVYGGVWVNHDGKLTLGISAYGFDAPARDVQKTGIILKKKLRDHGVSIRLIPNAEPALNSATSHHNKLGLASNKVELIVVRASSGKVIVAESIGAQNITAIAARDQARPKTDAFVGMLPPKLARIMVNLALGKNSNRRVLDPFCGTGVVPQESLLLDNEAYGTDLSQKMVDFSTINLQWLTEKYSLSKKFTIELGDAMNYAWTGDIDAVVAETYLGQPFSAPPSTTKLTEVRDNCNHIISTFLSNIHQQLQPGTTLCLAVPAWRDTAGRFTHLPLINNLERLGYSSASLTTVRLEQLLYYREDQVVARQLLVLTRK